MTYDIRKNRFIIYRDIAILTKKKNDVRKSPKKSKKGGIKIRAIKRSFDSPGISGVIRMT